jgi:hypothetical protein
MKDTIYIVPIISAYEIPNREQFERECQQLYNRYVQEYVKDKIFDEWFINKIEITHNQEDQILDLDLYNQFQNDTKLYISFIQFNKWLNKHTIERKRYMNAQGIQNLLIGIRAK